MAIQRQTSVPNRRAENIDPSLRVSTGGSDQGYPGQPRMTVRPDALREGTRPAVASAVKCRGVRRTFPKMRASAANDARVCGQLSMSRGESARCATASQCKSEL